MHYIGDIFLPGLAKNYSSSDFEGAHASTLDNSAV